MRYAILAPALLLAACSQESAPFQPGQWEYQLALSAGQEPDVAGSGGQCADPAEADDLPTQILSNSPFGNCSTSSASYRDGKLSIVASCDGKAPATTMAPGKVSLEGSYTATSIDARLSAELDSDGPVKQLSGKLSARRTGDCPASNQGSGS